MSKQAADLRLVDCILAGAGQWSDWTSWMRVLGPQS